MNGMQPAEKIGAEFEFSNFHAAKRKRNIFM
jgi:hypothetical protein